MFKDIYPKNWTKAFSPDKTFIDEYKSLTHFKQHIKGLSQIEDKNCGISYKDAVTELLRNKSTMTKGDYEIIKNRVANNLLKRGLISDNVYESYKYDVEGDLVDVAKVIAEDPACCLVPNVTYKNFFYELYISVSYPYHVSNETVKENMAKILATVELLEKEHYYCKITLVMPNRNCNSSTQPNYFGIIPLFSHRETKNIETMSSILNDRLLRKFFFAIWENKYKETLDSGYGHAENIEYAIVPVDLDECDLASNIIKQVLEKGTR